MTSTARARGQVHATVQQPQTQGHGHQGHRHRAQRVQHQGGEEGDPQGPGADAAQGVVAHGQPGTVVSRPPESPQRRQPFEQVADLAAQVFDLTPPLAGERHAGPADERPEDGEQGHHHGHDQRRQPVDDPHRGQEGKGRHRRQDQVGKAPAHVDVKGVQAPAGQRRGVARPRRGPSPGPSRGWGAGRRVAVTSRERKVAIARVEAEAAKNSPARATTARAPTPQAKIVNHRARSTGAAPGMALANRWAKATAWATTAAVATRPVATEAATLDLRPGSSLINRLSNGPEVRGGRPLGPSGAEAVRRYPRLVWPPPPPTGPS